MALASDSSMPFDSIHASIYKEASRQMTPKDFEAISLRQPELMRNSEAFRNLLHYYTIKPGYNLVVRFFHFVGFNILAATYLPSIISYFLIGCLMLVWLQKVIPSPFSAITALVLMASPFLFTTARYSSPDMLCALLSFAGLFLIVESSMMAGLVVLLLAITIRPDSAILFVPIVVALYKSKKVSGGAAFVFAIVAIALTLLIIHGPYIVIGFLFTTSDYSTSWSTSEFIRNYGSSLVSGITSLLSTLMILFSIIAAATIYIRKKSGYEIMTDLWSQLMLAVVATFAIRFLLHPVVEDRFLISCYLIIMMGLCKTLGGVFGVKNT